jgi:hypothetical protein
MDHVPWGWLFEERSNSSWLIRRHDGAACGEHAADAVTLQTSPTLMTNDGFPPNAACQA